MLKNYKLNKNFFGLRTPIICEGRGDRGIIIREYPPPDQTQDIKTPDIWPAAAELTTTRLSCRFLVQVHQKHSLWVLNKTIECVKDQDQVF